MENHYLKPIPKQQGHFRTYVPFLTPTSADNKPHERSPISLKSLEKAFVEFNDLRAGNNPGWFGAIGVALVTPLWLEQRQSVCNKANSFDYKKDTPDKPLQGLNVRTDAQERLAEEAGNVFGHAVWLDISEHGVLQLRISDSKERPSHGEMTNPLQASKYNTIEKEGDGYRSYLGICLSLLVAARPVSLIDEPELCLHPPQAYHIGRFIGKYAPDDHVTFVATHSSHVLRGILETGVTCC